MSEYGEGYILKESLLNLIEWDNDIEQWVIIDDDFNHLMTEKNDVAPVVHAHWIEDDHAYATCSRCGYEMDYPEYKTPYCPQCGVRMDGGDEK